jgi:hypothetical protein
MANKKSHKGATMKLSKFGAVMILLISAMGSWTANTAAIPAHGAHHRSNQYAGLAGFESRTRNISRRGEIRLARTYAVAQPRMVASLSSFSDGL